MRLLCDEERIPQQGAMLLGCLLYTSFNDAIIEGEGVYIEELKKAIEERGLDIPLSLIHIFFL